MDADASWTTTDFILADLYDLVVAAHSDEAGQRKAKPYPRPVLLRDEQKRREHAASDVEAFRVRAAQREALLARTHQE